MFKLQPAHIILFVIMLAFTACGTTEPFLVPQERQEKNFYHASTAVSTPLLRQKNDLHFQLNGAFSRYSWVEMQAAFAVDKHIGFTATYAANDVHEEAYFRAVNLGMGYFKKVSPHFHFETYGGYEIGSIENFHKTGKSRLRMHKWYVQPGVALTNKENTSQLILISRFSTNRVAIRDSLYSPDREPYTLSQLRTVGLHPGFGMWEPGLFYSIGLKQLMFTGGYRYSVKFNKPEFERVKGVVTLSMLVRLNTSKKVAD